jgi:hypothetical protein
MWNEFWDTKAWCLFRRTGTKEQGLAWVLRKPSGQVWRSALASVIDSLLYKAWIWTWCHHHCRCCLPLSNATISVPLTSSMITIDSIWTLSLASYHSSNHLLVHHVKSWDSDTAECGRTLQILPWIQHKSEHILTQSEELRSETICNTFAPHSRSYCPHNLPRWILIPPRLGPRLSLQRRFDLAFPGLSSTHGSHN